MKTYLAAILALFFILSPVSVYAAASFVLNVSAKEVLRGDEITLSGTSSKDVVVKIVRPNESVFYMDVIEPVSGNYSMTITIPESEDSAPWGTYKVVASSGSNTLNAIFRVVEKLGAGDDTPQNGGGDGGTVTKPTDPIAIPPGAGSSSGTVIHPEVTKNGSYIVGSDTLASVIDQAKDAITIELPKSTGTPGTSLEFPAQSLKALKDKGLDIIIVSDNSKIRFPAGSIAASNGEDEHIRIVVNTLLTDEAQTIIKGTLASNPDYVSTGVVLSVTIQLVSFGSIVDVHNLDSPASVTMELTKEQEKLLASNLAGVYYVNGTKVEYVGGKVSNGMFTFKANHFSLYTILEFNKQFADLAGHWAEKSVKSLTAKHIVNGVDEHHYAPTRNITRAEYATMIMRAIDWTGSTSAAAGANSFKDVAVGQYYTEAVTQAASLGIVSGYDGMFRPNDKITREEAIIALVHATKYFKFASTGKGAPAFSDAKSISAWAASAVNDAWKLGLIEGDGKQFNPKKPLTRAEVAVMINRLLPNGSL
ncbi:S-layer homology domain-containing protein [Paenibacillus sp. CF384]|uniref:S-layer homology domain-containing protein n=1 Tax=Paenibacillus sp. CF384 TaxID=1884382 RepID=UPI0008960048|nr:S-layer homology domain-containing protein [Paenibacillus sp. CF384]SDX06053.1 S-layer homology domain-containing protein [Paenibacillus sp. CF384]